MIADIKKRASELAHRAYNEIPSESLRPCQVVLAEEIEAALNEARSVDSTGGVATLKIAVESGRRWRFRYSGDGVARGWSEWIGPLDKGPELTFREACYSEFQIEPL